MPVPELYAKLYLVADAVSGQPVAGATVEFFGVGMNDPFAKPPSKEVRNFAEKSR